MRSSRSSSDASVRSAMEVVDDYQIFVKLLSGESELLFHTHNGFSILINSPQPAIPLSIPSSTTITTLRQLLSIRTSLPPTSLRLVHAGKHLTTPSSANSTLSSLNVPPSATIDITLPLRGGAPKKIRCTHKDCKEPAQRIVGDCSFCNGHFCGRHRMLEDHKCTGLEDCKKESHERNADKLNSERTLVVKGIWLERWGRAFDPAKQFLFFLCYKSTLLILMIFSSKNKAKWGASGKS